MRFSLPHLKVFASVSTFLFVLVFCTCLSAQDVASITGTVTDPTGALIPGVSVTLQSASTSTVYSAITNSIGSYVIPNVAPGPGYTINFSHNGFSPLVITGLYLNVNSTRTQNAHLTVGGTSQTVEVSATNETITLDTTDATVGNNFQVQFLNELPIAIRDSPAVLFTQQPGTTLDGAVTGARTDQSHVILDGLDVNDFFVGNFGAIIANAPVDSIQEFRGVTAGNLASAGEGGGGQYELLTRSGTNKFHGALAEYFRNTNLEANDWFNNDGGIPRPPLIRNQFGGNLGGPIKHNKVFFFFDWNSRHDTLSSQVERLVPTDTYRSGTIRYYTHYPTQSAPAPAYGTLNSAQVASLDPQGTGFDASILSLFASRYPHANDIGGPGDHLNTAGFRFNAPFPYIENNYVGRVDYTLTTNQKLWGRLTFTRTNGTAKPIYFPGDPETHPFLDKSYAWVAGHTWTIGMYKSNQFSWGETVTNFNFPDTFNPTGITQYTQGFGGNGSGGTILSGPYALAAGAQNRLVPVPVIRDDFTWLMGRHTFKFGGSFKYINPDSNIIQDYNQPTIGLGGNMPTLNASLRPGDIDKSSPTARTRYDAAFALALGRFASVSSTFDFDSKGNLLPQGNGRPTNDRFYETEIYFADAWKVTPSLTISYGLRWQDFSVPYEKNGIESLPSLNFDQYFSARVAQSAAGKSGDASLPFVSYSLGGKANRAPGYFQPAYKNFAPRFAFAWSPSYDRKSVFSGGAGIVYDRTVVSSLLFQAGNYSYLFQEKTNLQFGIPNNPAASLTSDPRFSGFSTPPPNPTPPAAIKPPYAPYVANGVPLGLANGFEFNEGVTNTLKTPYSIMFNLGFQHEFPAGLFLKANYVGRLGRRLLAQADANQLIDFPDTKSGQMMSAAFANISLQRRSLEAAGRSCGYANTPPVTAQPWFEDVLQPGLGRALGFASNSDLVACGIDPLPYRGDFADTIAALASLNKSLGPVFPSNVGMGSQFSEFTYYTNLGSSSYHGLLLTLHKNVSHGLQFDLNYTWSHSMDNVSLPASTPAIAASGFICDVLRPRECRGNSDFDVAQYLNGNFLYDLPFGRRRAFGAIAPFWLNEAIGGWKLSGIPTWHTGNAYFAASNAYVAGYANDAPAILTGPIADMKMSIHKAANGTLWAYKTNNGPATADYTGPVGLQIGSRNNLRGPGFSNLDLGIGKTFPLYRDRVNLVFRCDAFNVLNHPSFDWPNNDITETYGPFGAIFDTLSTARVLQGSLRFEF